MDYSIFKEKLYGMFILTLALVESSASAFAENIPSDPPNAFNPYIVKAVNHLAANYSKLGYGPAHYTHAMKYGKEEIQPGLESPATVCVSAVAQVIVTALNFHMEETQDYSPAKYLPVSTWSRFRPSDIRSHIWVDRHLRSYGTADALSTFGVGRHASFNQLTPGAFINFSRTNRTGHAVIFMGYLDSKGEELSAYSDDVAGFKYFSSQGGKAVGAGGMGFKYAFFNVNGKPFCPKLGDNKSVDCLIINSFSPKMLNAGYMLLPKAWDAGYRDRSLTKLANHLYQQNYSRSPPEGRLPGANKRMSRKDFNTLLDERDTMALNPMYQTQDLPDDQ